MQARIVSLSLSFLVSEKVRGVLVEWGVREWVEECSVLCDRMAWVG